jgi:hypothetical protein
MVCQKADKKPGQPENVRAVSLPRSVAVCLLLQDLDMSRIPVTLVDATGNELDAFWARPASPESRPTAVCHRGEKHMARIRQPVASKLLFVFINPSSCGSWCAITTPHSDPDVLAFQFPLAWHLPASCSPVRPSSYSRYASISHTALDLTKRTHWKTPVSFHTAVKLFFSHGRFWFPCILPEAIVGGVFLFSMAPVGRRSAVAARETTFGLMEQLDCCGMFDKRNGSLPCRAVDAR